jgi:hypothetical protein
MANHYNPTMPATASVRLAQRSLSWAVVIRDGAIAGALGAAMLACWFLLLDTIAGRPFYTPTVLGTAFLRWGLEAGTLDHSALSLGRVLAYSLVHWLAFAVLGGIASFILRLQTEAPNLAMGTMIFFVVFVLLESGFRLARAILFDAQIETVMIWEHVAIGNLLAAAVMGYYLMRRRYQ